MLLEARAGQGMAGADLDALIPSDAGLPPTSYLLAGWVSASASPAAALARRIMGVRDWTQAPSIVFPGLVLALYVGDASLYANALSSAPNGGVNSRTGGSSPATTAARFVRPTTGVAAAAFISMRPTVVGICSKVQGFIDGTIGAVFDALGHLEAPQAPSTGTGILGSFGAGLQAAFDLGAGIVNGLIDAGRFLVVNGVKLATQPILDQIARVAGVLAVATSIVSLLRPWTLRMDAVPGATRKAVGEEPGLPGTVSATVDLGGLDQWPADIADCAQQAGVPLPPLKPEGAPITWTIEQSPGDLVTEDSGRATVLDHNARAEAGYATTEESEDVAKGDPLVGIVKAHASIRRKEIADLQMKVSGLLLDQIPSLVRGILVPILEPILAEVLGALPALLDTNGYASVPVVYHEMSTTTTSSSTTLTSLAGVSIDPCALVTEAEAAAELGYDPGPGADDGTHCEYGSGTPGAITVTVRTGPGQGDDAVFQQSLAAAQSQTSNGFNTVNGLGDGAFAVLLGPGALIAFHTGDTIVVVFIRFADPHTPNPSAQAQALASAAAARL